MTVGAVQPPSQANANPEIETASIYVKSRDPRVVELGLKLFKSIVKSGQGYAEATAVSSRFLDYDGTEVIFYLDPIQRAGFKLLKHLTDRGHGQAAEVAAKWVEPSKLISHQMRGVELLTTLVKNGQAYNFALKTGLSFLERDDSYALENRVIELLRALVEKDQSCDKITTAISTYLTKVSNQRNGNAAIELFKTLIGKKYGFHKATQVAIELTGSPTDWRRSLGISLFKALVKEGQSYPEATRAAKQLKNFDLFRTLVIIGQGYQEAEEAVSLFARSQVRSGITEVMMLSIHLIASGRFFDEGENIGLLLLASAKFHDRWWAINLFIALAAQGRAIESGKNAISSLEEVPTLAAEIALLKDSISRQDPSGEQ